MLDAYVEGASSETLEDQLQYVIPPTSTAVQSRREATIFSSGGDSYSPAHGVRACVFRIAGDGNQFLDPSSLFFPATYHNDPGAILTLKGSAWCAFSRVTCRLAGTSVEDVSSFGRLYTMLHLLSPAEEQVNAKISAGDKDSTIGNGETAKFGFPLAPLALTRCNRCIPLSLAPLELTLEIVPSALLFAKTADQSANPSAWHLSDCQLKCTTLTLDAGVQEQIHKHTMGGRNLPISLPGTWFCVDQTSTENGTFHLSKNASRAEKLLCSYTSASGEECYDFLRPTLSSAGSWELLVGSKRYPDRSLSWDDTPAFWDMLTKTVAGGGRSKIFNITRGDYVTQTSPDRKSFVIGIPLVKSPGDRISEISYTGENLRTGALVSVQQKGCSGPNRIWLALQYSAIIEIGASEVSLLE